MRIVSSCCAVTLHWADLTCQCRHRREQRTTLSPVDRVGSTNGYQYKAIVLRTAGRPSLPGKRHRYQRAQKLQSANRLLPSAAAPDQVLPTVMTNSMQHLQPKLDQGEQVGAR